MGTYTNLTIQKTKPPDTTDNTIEQIKTGVGDKRIIYIRYTYDVINNILSKTDSINATLENYTCNEAYYFYSIFRYIEHNPIKARMTKKVGESPYDGNIAKHSTWPLYPMWTFKTKKELQDSET